MTLDDVLTRPTLTAAGAAAMLNIHEETLYKMIAAGEIPAAKIGRGFVMMQKDVLEYLSRQITRQTAERMGGRPVRRRRSPQLVGKV